MNIRAANMQIFSEKSPKLTQKLGQLQPFMKQLCTLRCTLPQESMGQKEESVPPMEAHCAAGDMMPRAIVDQPAPIGGRGARCIH
jgi:hypothetical protein